ncbi:MAG: protein translocase subunit SecF [Patescibacteria group bacterium]
MFIVKNRKVFYTFSAILLALSIGATVAFGLKFGIDFTGGSLLEVSYANTEPKTQADVVRALESIGIEGSSVRPTGETGYLIRTPFLNPTQYSAVRAALGGEEIRYDSIGPTIGSELQTRAIWAIILVLIVIALFIAFVFRQVSKPVSSWKYGLIALIALAHDVIVPVGAFAVLGYFFGAEVDTLFVTALLVVLGFSVHDSIVVFDRVRENLKHLVESNTKEPFEITVGRSVQETLARSINTSLTTVLALIALYIFGPDSIKYFSLTLLIGIIAGTYSSVCIGSPLLVTLEKLQKEPAPEDEKKKKR